MRIFTLRKYFITSVVSAVFIVLPMLSYAFDLDAAVDVYQDAVYEEYSQDLYQQPQQAPQGHSREYYQQKWLESQGVAQPTAMHRPQNQPQQARPEAEDLFMAAVNGNNGQIGRLISQGLNINAANAERETALHMAAARGHYSTVIYLINNGAHVNARTVKNWIPLHHAVRFRHANIVNYLLQRGSSAGARTSDGLSAIDMARNANDNRLLSILGGR
ncbi:MAG: ankyrin repeat domain-containing protein [Cocleimonas sp.]|nr:ankyrin repeat domain-containing protein [Cocleimonas sp.]